MPFFCCCCCCSTPKVISNAEENSLTIPKIRKPVKKRTTFHKPRVVRKRQTQPQGEGAMPQPENKRQASERTAQPLGASVSGVIHGPCSPRCCPLTRTHMGVGFLLKQSRNTPMTLQPFVVSVRTARHSSDGRERTLARVSVCVCVHLVCSESKQSHIFDIFCG